MKKTVAFKSPIRAPGPADAWVAERRETPEVVASAPAPTVDDVAEAMKRFTIDVPSSLHTRVKIGCATRGVKMADVIRGFLESEFPPEGGKIVKAQIRKGD